MTHRCCVKDSPYTCCEVASRPGLLSNHSNRKYLRFSQKNKVEWPIHFISLLSKTIAMLILCIAELCGLYAELEKMAIFLTLKLLWCSTSLLPPPSLSPPSFLSPSPFWINTYTVTPELIDPFLFFITYPGHLQTLSPQPRKIPWNSRPGHWSLAKCLIRPSASF